MMYDHSREDKNIEEPTQSCTDGISQNDPEPLIIALEFLAVIAAVSQLAVDIKYSREQHRQRIHEWLEKIDTSFDSIEMSAKQFNVFLDRFGLRDKKLELGQLGQELTNQEISDFLRLYNYITVEQKKLVIATINLSGLLHLRAEESTRMKSLQKEANARIQMALRSQTYGKYLVEIAAGLSTLDHALDLVAQKYSYKRSSSLRQT